MEFKIGEIVADRNIRGINGEWPCFMGQITKIGKVKLGRCWIPALVIRTLAGKKEVAFQEDMINISKRIRDSLPK